jgi:hypothetical protein
MATTALEFAESYQIDFEFVSTSLGLTCVVNSAVDLILSHLIQLERGLTLQRSLEDHGIVGRIHGVFLVDGVGRRVLSHFSSLCSAAI